MSSAECVTGRARAVIGARVIFTKTGSIGTVTDTFTMTGAGDLDGDWFTVRADDLFTYSAPATSFEVQS
jgi:hypothetical protein